MQRAMEEDEYFLFLFHFALPFLLSWMNGPTRNNDVRHAIGKGAKNAGMRKKIYKNCSMQRTQIIKRRQKT
jgi:hypothetical protein